MSSRDKKHPWSVFHGVKTVSSAPEVLMAEIDAAIAALEYARASASLQSPPPITKAKNINKISTSQYDAQMADEAYKTGLASMAAGKLDEAVVSLNVALSKCPPDKASAVAKIQSLISTTSQQLKMSSN
ncbi:hypothetical protein CDL12_14569 [Handroanthus impetiginosus]|uniref:Uncharacterized protein n=1 Tax=Handroanthus impetiginosus TaxID=429701 RepID=A0A2G9H5L5_9LAMI|nr:hypothetical protein CDL12_14569 [Handroanthus impetiginosus]